MIGEPMKRRSHHFTALLTTTAAFLGIAGSAHAASSAASDRPGKSTVEVAPGATGLTATAWHRADAATEARANDWIVRLQSGWNPNRGQIADGSGRPSSRVLYSTTVRDAQVYVTTTGISHYFLARKGDEEGDEEHRPGDRSTLHRDVRDRKIEWCRLDVTLAGAQIRPDRVRVEEPPAGQGGTNYYLPHCPNGVLDVPTYGTLTFPEVYPGIDWIVRNTPGEGVHQDFVVRPGADAGRIRLEYAGAQAIEVSDDRQSLRIRTPLGEVREGALHCSQEDGRKIVGARFRIDGNAVSIDLDPYDRSRPLVIDPPLVWSTYYGGTDYDGPRTIYCDNVNDFVYVVGYTGSTDMPVMDPGGSAFQDTTSVNQDGFIWKFTQQGVRLWATYYGGSLVEFLADCTVDPSGNLYVGGYTSSTDLPTQPLGGAYNQVTNGGATDAVILKFDANGVRLWATYYGRNGADQVDAMTTDATGKLYVAGVTSSGNLTAVDPGGGAYVQSTPGSAVDAFVLRFNTLGALEWATYLGGDDYDDATGITTSNSHLYVTGFTQSPVFPTFDPGGGAYYEGTYQGGTTDAFIARFTLAGVRTWSTYYGGTGSDYADEVAVDGAGNLFVFGDTDSPNFLTLDPGGSAYYQNTLAGMTDFFLLKFNGANARVWGTYYGGSGQETTAGTDQPLALDAQGNVYVTGMTSSTDFPVLNPGGGSFFQGTFGGLRDAVLGQFSNGGVRLWSTYLRSNLTDFGTGVAIGTSGCLFATGESSGPNNFVTQNPLFGAWYQPANAGDDDGYIVKFCSPPSSCCTDFNCVPVFTQAQCTQIGGTAFYPNQPCSVTVCIIDCKICGRKYSDLNRNGVQDPGEPGLQGWTIRLFYPNGTLYASMTTDASGNYCFNSIPCGAWKVNEVMPPTWVQTFPSPSVHTLNLPIATTQNGVDFGNYSCGPTPACPPLPPRLVAWWPFNEPMGSATANDATHVNPARNVAELHVDASGVGSTPDALCLMTDADYARVPKTNQIGLEFAGGSFSIAAWLDVTSSSASPRSIVEKRIRIPNSDGLAPQTRGWALSLNGLQSSLEIGNGSATQVVPGPDVPPDTWSHLAVSIDRAAGEGRWYLNGTPQAAFDFVPLGGLVSSGADLYMGHASPAFGASAAFQGCIADLALFDAPLSAANAGKAAAIGPGGWCPEYALMPQTTTICQSQTAAQVCFNLCNNYATPQTYHWSLAGLPAGPGCTVAGPTVFSPTAGTVTVAPGSCSPPICVTITRPPGMTAQNATACFALTFLNDATGVCRVKTGTLRNDNSCWCATPIPSGIVALPPGPAGATIGIAIRNPCGPPMALAYQLRAVWPDPDGGDPLELSLNGLPPGTPVTGTINTARGNEQQINVNATLPNGYDPAAQYEIVLEADTDGDGALERLCGTVVAPTADEATEIVGVPSHAPLEESVRLVTRPNPFVRGTSIGFTLPRAAGTTLGVYDLSGRLVRSLQRGRLSAGAQRFDWTGRNDAGRRVAAGIYFVNLDGPGLHVRTKIVKVQ
jgi:hypothetical protein